ncbi:MAG: ATP-binding protein [Chloroflexi bacterium]|nr:ATP-binding protein [Chloroflexota bacterium]
MKPRDRSTRVRFAQQNIGAIVRPFVPVKEPLVRRRMQLLASLTLLVVLFSLIGLACIPLLNVESAFIFCWLLGGLFLISLGLYFLSRSRWYRITMFLAVALTVIVPFAALFSLKEYRPEDFLPTLMWLILSFLLAVSLLTLQSAMVLIACVIGGTLLLPFINPEITYINLLPVIGFLSASAALIIINIIYREKVEADRRREVLAKKESSERMEAKQAHLIRELETKNEELERFTYTVSHDLKSPLITIRGFLGFLERDVMANNKARITADLQRITDATEKMRRLLDDLLNLSRVGRIVHPPENVPFDEIVADAAERAGGRIRQRGAYVRIAEGLPIVRVDRERLIEVIQNLLDNAVKFMGDQTNPTVEIGTRGFDKSGKAILFVRDNGIGIDPQYHERIFGLFDKLDPSSEGTGIGLALVKRIIEVHGGKIWVESEGHRTGSVFVFTLPAVREQEK